MVRSRVWLNISIALAFSIIAGFLSKTEAQSTSVPIRRWSLEALVEVARIEDIAISPATGTVAYIVKRPSVSSGRNEFTLYEMTSQTGAVAKPIASADYMADLQYKPPGNALSFRADFGEGVMLYQFTSGDTTLLLRGSISRIGGSDGLLLSSDELARPTGVVAYGWSPAGDRLWYSTLRPATNEQWSLWNDGGIRYDAEAMAPYNFTREPSAAALELRIYEPASRRDVFVAAVGGDPASTSGVFDELSTAWLDETNLQFASNVPAADGGRRYSLHTIDSESKARTNLTVLPSDLYYSIPYKDGRLIVREQAGRYELASLDASAPVINPIPVNFRLVGTPFGIWPKEDRASTIFGAYGLRKDGLWSIDSSGHLAEITPPEIHATNCAIESSRDIAVCSGETQSIAPHLISIQLSTSRVIKRIEINSRYTSLEPFRIQHSQWTNKFGNRNDGYVIFPRKFEDAQRSPVIIVSHGNDAKQAFAAQALQWDYPIQVFVEEGFVVVLANEAPLSRQVRDVAWTGSGTLPVSQVQLELGFNAIATMDAIVEDLVKRGVADPTKIGIAGYSRGGIVAMLAMSHSAKFAAAASGDTMYYNPSGYWQAGESRQLYNLLYGGPPGLPKTVDNYRAFAPAARADLFSGPLLQQFAAAGAYGGLELHYALQHFDIPSELFFYVDEAHIFVHPRRRLAAMQLNLDWFNFWLHDIEREDEEVASQYQRWRELRDRWRRSQRSH